MKNLDLLPVGDEVRQAIRDTDANYRRFIQVRTDILEVDATAKTVTVRIEQVQRLTDKVFDRKELIDKAREVFSHLPEGWQLKFRPLVWKGSGIDAVSQAWVKNQLKKHGLSQKQLAADMGVDEPAMTKLLKNELGFTRWHRAAFYYYFKARS